MFARIFSSNVYKSLAQKYPWIEGATYRDIGKNIMNEESLAVKQASNYRNPAAFPVKRDGQLAHQYYHQRDAASPGFNDFTVEEIGHLSRRITPVNPSDYLPRGVSTSQWRNLRHWSADAIPVQPRPVAEYQRMMGNKIFKE